MKSILYISPFNIYPIESGFATRTYQILKYLSNSNKLFFLYTSFNKKTIQEQKHFLDNVNEYEFTASKRWMQVFHPLLLINALILIKKRKIDLIIAEGIWTGFHAVLLHFLTRVPFYFDEHNAEYIRWKRMGNKNSSLLKLYEKYCCKYAQKVFCVSETDQKFIHELGVDLKKIIVVPNGYDPEIFFPNNKNKKTVREKINVSNETPLILFSGNFNYKPNLQAVSIIHDMLADKVLDKVPNAKFLIVGAHPPLQYKHKGIIFTGFVDKIEDYINASDVVIAPLVSGGGTKLKIIEAMSCSKVVITTNIGAEGLVGEKTNNFLVITDDWNQFANEIVSALKSPVNNDISEEFIEMFSWDKVVKKMNDIFYPEVISH